jgi:hypothetical protein
MRRPPRHAVPWPACRCRRLLPPPPGEPVCLRLGAAKPLQRAKRGVEHGDLPWRHTLPGPRPRRPPRGSNCSAAAGTTSMCVLNNTGRPSGRPAGAGADSRARHAVGPEWGPSSPRHPAVCWSAGSARPPPGRQLRGRVLHRRGLLPGRGREPHKVAKEAFRLAANSADGGTNICHRGTFIEVKELFRRCRGFRGPPPR